MTMNRLALVALSLVVLPALAQPVAVPPPNAGTLVVMTGSAEIELPNDEAVANFYYEAQDADLTRAQALVNQRVADGTAALKRADPKAHIETSGYGSFPVYSSGSNRSIVGWRVRQGVTLKTDNLAALPKTVAAAQSTLSVGGIDFRLSRSARERVDAQLIQQAIANLNARVAAAAQALGVPASRVRMEEVNFGGREGGPIPVGVARMATMSSDAVPPPNFESGRSAERLIASGKARLLP
jgi:predicted secreted protein